MICPKCKTEVSGPAVFCPECGVNMMETLSEDAPEIKEQAQENAEAAFEETRENMDWVEEKIEVAQSTSSDVASSVSEAAEEIPESISVQPDNVYAPSPEAVVVTASATPEVYPPAKKQKKQKSISVDNNGVTKENKPFTTGGAFWYLFLLGVPIIGFIALMIFAFASKNKNRKSVARAILIYCIIFFLISLILSILAYIVLGGLIEDLNEAESVQEIIELVLEELESRFG